MRSRAAGAARVAARCHRVNGQVHAPHDQVGADQYERPVETPLGVVQASGIVRATTNSAAIATAMAARTTPVSARAWLLSQAYAHQVHHSSARTSRPWSTPNASCACTMAGNLGRGEHVDEVEEEFEGCSGIVLARGARATEDPGASFACFGDDDHLFLHPCVKES